jgi:hypothetical protein
MRNGEWRFSSAGLKKLSMSSAVVNPREMSIFAMGAGNDSSSAVVMWMFGLSVTRFSVQSEFKEMSFRLLFNCYKISNFSFFHKEHFS